MPLWNLVRLELASTPEFPAGSASRAYMLRLPLGDDGEIDEAAVRAHPARASVRRFWPNEADRQGHLVRTVQGWAFSYALGGCDDERVCNLECCPIRVGECLTLTEPDGRRFPFRVVRAEPEAMPARTRH